MFSSCFHQNDFSSFHRWLRENATFVIAWRWDFVKSFSAFLRSISIKAKQIRWESVFDLRQFTLSCWKTDEVSETAGVVVSSDNLTKLCINFLLSNKVVDTRCKGLECALRGCEFRPEHELTGKILLTTKSLKLLDFLRSTSLSHNLLWNKYFRISLLCKNIFLLLYIWKIVFIGFFSFRLKSRQCSLPAACKNYHKD